MKEIALEGFEEEATETVGPDGEWSYERHGTAAWYAGNDDGTLFFGVAYDQLEDAERLAGVLAHEVAHAWRDHHAVMVEDEALEEQLTDITAGFLGFGVLTANNAFRVRTAVGADVRESVISTGSGGYLSPQAHSFLLAAQLAARGRPGPELAKVRDALERNQRATVDAALDLPELEPKALRARLGLPEPAQWPASAPWPELPVAQIRPLSVEDLAHQEPPKRDPSDTATRVHKSATMMFGLAGPAAGLLLGLLKSPLFLLLVPAAFLAGSRLGSWRCSKCDMVLKQGEERCPDCGRRLTSPELGV